MNRFPLFLLLLLVACNDDTEPTDPCADNLTASFEPCSSEQTVSADQCIVLEALIEDASGNVIDKFVYHHDGTNYNQIDRYYVDSEPPSPDTPAEVIKLSYQGGAVFQTIVSIRQSPGITWVTTFTYEDIILKRHLDIIKEDGSVEFSQDFEEFYVSPPEDSVYFYDGPITDSFDFRSLFESKDGNITRRARPSNEGICTSQGVTWIFRKNYYDDKPNLLTDYAVRYPFMEGKGIYGLMPEAYVQANVNNIIGRVGNDGLNDGTSPYCWTFLKNGKQMYWIKQFSALDRPNGNITYYYDCE